MRILTFCAIVIAASTLASAVEQIYGWDKVKPVAEEAWSAAYDWGNGLLGGDARAQGGAPPAAAPAPRDEDG